MQLAFKVNNSAWLIAREQAAEMNPILASGRTAELQTHIQKISEIV
jgi:hypothetical protein